MTGLRHGLASPARLLVWLFTVLALLPFLLVAVTSLKSQPDVLRGAFTLPSRLHFENYATAWFAGHFQSYFVNSLIVVVPVVVASVALGTLSGFAFAFMTLPFKRTIGAVLAIGMMVPHEAYIIPLYHEMRWIGLLNSYWALILPQIGMSMPFATLFMASAMRQLPTSIIEAAVVDGKSRMLILRQIVLPLSRSAMSTLALFIFIWTWNEFLLPLILATDDATRTLPLGMLFFQGRYTANIPVLTSGAVIIMGPLIVIYIAFQRRFVEGLTSGAVK